ncbi:H/ACA ribonucleoprotein complex non-core subunit naf1 [Arthrobotrys conoides]|uniref:H/ACA ribonucleoprotein complex non-core subunit NAF1 n=1 Tax=Arthrobotrys conoides TaxID=74498 RepID=A0AAN8S3S8_9PEZI
MDSDPIVYGDVPEYSHDDQPRPKRPRLSTEDPDDEVTAAILASPPSNNSNIIINNKPDDPHPQADTIPGLFLATDGQIAPGIGLQGPKDGVSDQEALYPPPAATLPEENPELDGVNEEIFGITLVNDREGDKMKSGVDVEDGHITRDDDNAAYLITSNPDELSDEREDLGAFRGKEDFIEKGIANMGDPEAEWQLDSSAEESDGDVNGGPHHSSSSSDDNDDDSSTTSGSDDDDDEGEDAVFLDIQKEARRLMDEDAGSDDEAGGGAKGRASGPLKTKNELPEAKLAPTRPDVDITASTPIVPLGTIDSVVDDLVLVKASVSGEYQVLNERSVLCFEDRSLLGWVQETFGRVEQPFYTVRLRDAEEAKQLNATVGRKVSYIPSYSTFLFTKSIRAVKGSDASNFFDEEVGDDEREFSDDEAEAEFRKRQKEEKKTRGAAFRSQGQAQPPAQIAMQSQAADAIDEPYVPLSRPANLHEMSAPPNQANLPPRREAPQRVPPRDFQSNRGSRVFRGRGRGGRQAPQGRLDFRSGPRHQNQGSDHHQHHHHNQHHQHRDDRVSGQTPNPPHPPPPPPPPQVPLPLAPPPDFSALLPFFAQGHAITMPPTYPSGSHINSAFFPIPPNPQLPLPYQLGQIPPPPHPPLTFNQASIPIPQQTQPPPPPPPSVEDILKILRSQGHNL